MKKVYFVQVDVSACLGSQNAYVPYTAGILAASAWISDTVKKCYEFGEFIFLREHIDVVVSRLDSPAVVFFINYCWNTEYNKLLASEIKKKYPNCINVFGGHNIPDSPSFLEKFSFIDILSHGEGEETTAKLLEAIADNTALSDVCNITFRSADGFVRTSSSFPRELCYPSPYIDGWFDDILKNHPEISFNAILETSRGCPNQCAYCDWGLLKSKVRLFPIERIKSEIEWMAKHKIAFVWGADANFGLYDRDVEIAQELVNAKQRYGYPEKMRMNYAKNRHENVFKIVKIFKDYDFDRIGATLSFQSMSPTVLKNIGRTNSDIDFYKNLLTKYNSERMKAYSELILGLPGETYNSFISGVGKLFEIGQHFVFDVYSCILLPNSSLGQPENVKKYKIESVRTEILRPHFQNSAFDIPEYNNIVTQTCDMPRDMWVRATTFYYLAKAFHGNGLLRTFAIYLYVHDGIKYEVFYDRIIDYFEKKTDLHISKLYSEIKEHAQEQSVGKTNRKLCFAPCGDIVWDDHEYLVLNILNDIDCFFEEIEGYLEIYNIPDKIYENLLNYQKNILRRPGQESVRIYLNYDIHGFMSDAYLNKIHTLEEKNHYLVMKDSDYYGDWKMFGKYVIWYGRMGWASYKEDVTIL